MASTSTNKQPMMLDRPASTSTLVRTQTGQLFATSLLPTSIGNVTKVFDVDQALTDTQISGAYIDEIFIRYTNCLLYTSPSPRDLSTSRMPSSA